MLGWLCRDSTGPMPEATTLIYWGSAGLPGVGIPLVLLPWSLSIPLRKQFIPSLLGLLCVLSVTEQSKKVEQGFEAGDSNATAR